MQIKRLPFLGQRRHCDGTLAPPPGEGDFFYIPQGICPVKDVVISVNNTVLYLSLAFIWLVAIVAIFTSGFLPALGIFVAGTLC